MPDTHFDLSVYRDRSRPLLLFAAHPDDTGFATQLSLLADVEAELAERDVVVIALHSDAESRVDDRSLTPEVVERLYRHFDVPPEGFMAILIGKDGTEKRREAAPVKPEAIFATIDAMPMRQQEQREAASGNGP